MILQVRQTGLQQQQATLKATEIWDAISPKVERWLEVTGRRSTAKVKFEILFPPNREGFEVVSSLHEHDTWQGGELNANREIVGRPGLEGLALSRRLEHAGNEIRSALIKLLPRDRDRKNHMALRGAITKGVCHWIELSNGYCAALSAEEARNF